MLTKKDRRHSGRKTIHVNDKDYPYQETFWDDWNDYRDGFRGSRDRSLIKLKEGSYCKNLGKNLDPKIKPNNFKLKRYYLIRKVRCKK